MKSARLLAASLMLALSVPAWAEPPADIGDSVEALRQKIGAVGVSIAIVEDGRTTLAPAGACESWARARRSTPKPSFKRDRPARR